MYPYKVFLGMTLYEIFVVLGVAAAFVVFRLLSDRAKLQARFYNFVVLDGIACVIGGYFSAVFFQAVYNWLETGEFSLSTETGMTFYGGLLGGAAVFFAIYFGAGHFVFRDKYNKKMLVPTTDMVSAAVACAHGFGRIGCLCAGCCHGRETSAWFGVWNEGLGYKTVPVQLFESAALFLLAAFLIVRCVKGKTYCLPYYLTLYGVWRFFIEYLRSDDRGASVVAALSPSQLTAVILTVTGIALFFIIKKFYVDKADVSDEYTEA